MKRKIKSSDEPFICIDHSEFPCVKDVKTERYICMGCFMDQLKEEK